MATMKTLKFPGSSNVYEMVDATARAGVASLQTTVGELVNDTAAASAAASSALTSASSALTDFAGAFSASTAYTAGQYVTYTDGQFYRFTTNHAAGAWNSAHVVAVTAGGELTDLMSALNLSFDGWETLNPEFHQGNYNNGYVDADNRIYADAIYVHAGARLKIKCGGLYLARIVVFNGYGQIENPEEVQFTKEADFYNASSNRFCVICLKKSDNSNLAPADASNVTIYSNDSTDIAHEIVYGKIRKGYVFDSGGNVNTSVYWCVSDIIDVSEHTGEVVYSNCWWTDSPSRYHLFLDKNLAKIQVLAEDEKITIPSNAKYGYFVFNLINEQKNLVTFAYISYGTDNVINPQNVQYKAPYDTKGIYNGQLKFRSETQLNDLYSFYDMLMYTFNKRMNRVQIGTTNTPTGEYYTEDPNTYPIYAYIISPKKVKKHSAVFASGHHGDQMSAGDGIEEAVCLAYFMKDMLFENNTEQTQYLNDYCEIAVVPAVNAWGYQNNHRCNERGVDLDRNYDINFVPNQQSSEGTSGPYAFSEAGSTALKNFVIENYASASFYVAMHCRGGNPALLDNRFLMLYTEAGYCVKPILEIVGKTLVDYYGGDYQMNYFSRANAQPSNYSYMQEIVGIPTTELEAMRSYDNKAVTFGSDESMIQNVSFVGNIISHFTKMVQMND